MLITACEIEIIIYGANSLKDKRSVVKSIVDKVRNRYKISIIESGDQNLVNKAKIGFCFCSLYEKDSVKKKDSIISTIENSNYAEIISIEDDIYKLDNEL